MPLVAIGSHRGPPMLRALGVEGHEVRVRAPVDLEIAVAYSRVRSDGGHRIHRHRDGRQNLVVRRVPKRHRNRAGAAARHDLGLLGPDDALARGPTTARGQRRAAGTMLGSWSTLLQPAVNVVVWPTTIFDCDATAPQPVHRIASLPGSDLPLQVLPRLRIRRTAWRPTSGIERRPLSTVFVDAGRCPCVARPRFPTSVIPAQSLPSRRRGRESIPDRARHHDPESSPSRLPSKSAGESGLARFA